MASNSCFDHPLPPSRISILPIVSPRTGRPHRPRQALGGQGGWPRGVGAAARWKPGWSLMRAPMYKINSMRGNTRKTLLRQYSPTPTRSCCGDGERMVLRMAIQICGNNQANSRPCPNQAHNLEILAAILLPKKGENSVHAGREMGGETEVLDKSEKMRSTPSGNIGCHGP